MKFKKGDLVKIEKWPYIYLSREYTGKFYFENNKDLFDFDQQNVCVFFGTYMNPQGMVCSIVFCKNHFFVARKDTVLRKL